MRVLVTGGAGFVGSHLVRALVARGDEVVVADNLVTARSLDLLGTARDDATYHHVDVRCPEDLARLPTAPYDVVFHLAASYANALSVESPLLDLKTNVEGTLYVLDHARRCGCALFVYAGTSSSYGDVPLPFAEDGPMRPQTPYAVHKLAAESHVRASGLPHAVFRLFNVYGPGDPPGRYRNVVPNMIAAAASGQPVRVLGEGATRDFNYVDDVVRVLVRPWPAVGLTLNIGTGVETPISDLARRVLALFGLPEDRVVREPARGWDAIPRRCADVRRLRELYGDAPPETSLDDGLRYTARWLHAAGYIARQPT